MTAGPGQAGNDWTRETNVVEHQAAQSTPGEPAAVEPDVIIESNVIEPDVVESDVIEPDVIEPDVMESDVVESDVMESDLAVSEVASGQPAASEPGPTSKSEVNGDDERWHDIVAGFIDDPRRSVAEAAELVEAEVTELIALLSRRRDRLGETWQNHQASASEGGSATEDLRLAMRDYREFSRQLAASVRALS